MFLGSNALLSTPVITLVLKDVKIIEKNLAKSLTDSLIKTPTQRLRIEPTHKYDSLSHAGAREKMISNLDSSWNSISK